MTFKQLAIEVSKREGKKQGVSIAQIYEILRCLGEIMIEDAGKCSDIWFILHSVGADGLPTPRRARKGKKK